MFYCTKKRAQESALISAAAEGKLSDIELILSTHGNLVDINSLNGEKQTALHMACENNKLEVVICLVEHGANVNALGLGGSTPLHTAAIFSCIEIIKYLLEKGADPNLKNNDSDSPIDYAERDWKTEVATCMRNFALLSLNYRNRP